MYDVRILNAGRLTRTRCSSLQEASELLKNLSATDKLVGVFQVLTLSDGTISSVEIPCFVEGDLVVLGKPM